MKRKIAFIDRDGTLVREPEDYQVDRIDKIALVPNVIPALLKLRALGYELVMVSNQDGLGTESFPTEDFQGPHDFMLDIFNSQGIEFDAIHIDPTRPEDNAPTRKPAIGMVIDYLKSGDMDLDRSVVIGDRETDLELARNMGIGGIRIGGEGDPDWLELVDGLATSPRRATVERNTRETRIRAEVNLDAPGPIRINTGIGFFDHMLDQVASHGGFSLNLTCDGDLEIDEHHTVEDCALAFGEAFRLALGDKRGIERFGFLLPMDETQAQVAIDLSGRPWLEFDATFTRESVGGLPTEMVSHFFRSFSQAMAATVHIRVAGDNNHHMIEACFKGLGRALRSAVRREAGSAEMPSTKGML